jgi:hypothetical protein
LLCGTIVISALAIGLKQTEASSRTQGTILVLTAAALTTQMQFRPQLFTFAMLSVVMAVLAIETYRGQTLLWPLVPMFALWANLHGGYVTGLGAIGIAAVVFTVQDIVAGVRPTRGLRLGSVTILAAVATVINPFGFGIWASVFHSVSNPTIRLIIIEWIPLPQMLLNLWHTSKIGLMEFAFPVALFVVFFWSTFRALTVDDLALGVIATSFIAAAFFVARNLALGLIALVIPLAHHLELGSAKPLRSSVDSTADQHRLRPVLITCLIAIVILAGGALSPRLPTWHPVPVGAVSFMKQRGLHGNILNEFEWGGFLVWHLAPKCRVFVDSRTELVYPDSLLSKYVDFYNDRPGGVRILDSNAHDFVLIKSSTKRFQLVRSDGRWKIIYQDGVATLFARTTAPIPRARNVPKSDATPRNYFP